MAKIEYLVHIDLTGNELQNAVIQNLSTAPSTPSAGQIYYDIEDANIYMWDGSAWIDLTSQGSGSTNLGYTASPTNGVVTSSTGTSATIPLATGINAGLLAPGDFTQLSNFADGDKGDITVSASGATWTIDPDAVTYAKIQNVSADLVLLGNDSGAGSIVQELTKTEVLAILNVADGANNYIHPNHTGHVTSTSDGATVVTAAAITGQTELTTGLASTDELLISDAGVIKRMDISVLQTYMQSNLSLTTTLAALTDTTITTPASGNILVYDGVDSWDNKAMSGDATIDNTGALTIANDAVTFAKMQNVATGTIFYRKTATTGDPEVQTLATLKTDLGLIGNNTGDQTITLTSDVTGSGTGSFATTISANAVTYAKFQQASAGFTIIAKSTTGAGNYAEITAATNTVLRRDGAGNLVFGTLVTGNIGDNQVTTAKLQQVATDTFLGRTTAATGNVEILTVADVKTMLDLIGSNSGDQTITLTGDVTGTGTGSFATTIAAGAIDYGMLNQTWIITQAEGIGSNDNETSIPTSAEVKEYVDNAVTGALIYQGGYNAATDTPSLDDGTPIAGILQGHTYTVTVAGDFFTEAVEAGDMLIAEVDSPTTLADWTIVNKNIPELGAPGADGSVTRRITFPTLASTITPCTHSLGDRYVQVDIYRATTPWDKVEAQVTLNSATQCTVTFNTATTAGEYVIVVIG